MQFQNTVLPVLLILSGIIILLTMLKSKHFLRSLVFSCGSGLAALFAVNMLSGATNVSVALNPVTAAVSALGGIPGVILLLVGRVMLT